MKRFSGHEEPWGQFLDVKINAPDVLSKEVKKKKPARVFISSVCDAYQPAEKRYKLTRACLEILVDAGFPVGILTKSRLVTRDFDILSSSNACDLGLTLTTTDEYLRFKIEPGASPTKDRISVLEEACSRGIKSWAFLGPFMPGLSDTDEALDSLISAVAPLPLSHIIADKLNLKPGVLGSILASIRRWRPDLIDIYKRYSYDREYYDEYRSNLRQRVKKIAEAYGLEDKLKPIF